MKVINLNESQYKRLFETSEFVTNAIGEPDATPINLGSEVYTDAVKTDKDGEDYLVKPGGSDIEKRNRFDGARRKSDSMSADGPWQRPGRIGGF